MYFSLWHWLPMVNGYSGYTTDSYRDFAKSLDAFPSPATLAALRSRGVTHVTITCGLYRNGCDTVMAAVDASDQFRLVTAAEWEGQPTRLYELRR